MDDALLCHARNHQPLLLGELDACGGGRGAHFPCEGWRARATSSISLSLVASRGLKQQNGGVVAQQQPLVRVARHAARVVVVVTAAAAAAG